MNELERAINKMDNGDVEQALSILEKFLQTANDEETFTVADLYTGWGFFEEAIELLETLLNKYPHEGQIITKLADLYIELERDDEAVQLLNQVKKNDPFYVSSLLQLADVYDAQGLFEVAEQKLLQAKEIEPDEKVIDFALGEFLFATGQYSRAIPFYEKVISIYQEFNYISIAERLAECHAYLGQYEKAYEYYKKTDTDHPDTLFKFGYTAKQQKDYPLAISIWKELLELDPYYHSVYSLLAETLKETGQIEEAKEIVELGLGYNEFDKELYFLSAQLSLLEEKQEKAIEQLEKAIAQDPDYKAAVLLLIDLLKAEEKDAEIIEFIEKINDFGASDPLYDWELAKAYEREERYEEALEQYKIARAGLEDDPIFLKEYGYFLAEEGLQDEARHVLEKYVALEPFDEEIVQFIERLSFSSDE